MDYTCVQRPCATRTSWKSPVLWEVGVNKGGPQVCWEEWETLDSAPYNSCSAQAFLGHKPWLRLH